MKELIKLAEEKGFEKPKAPFSYNEAYLYMLVKMQKWLRETQDIYVWVFPKFIEQHPYTYEGNIVGPNKKIYYEKSFYICAIQTPENKRIEISSGVNYKWEEILESGLKQALKLI